MIQDFILENRKVTARFLELTRRVQPSLRVVHHNDADGIAAAAALSTAFKQLGLTHRLIPVEKIYEPLVEKVHTGTGDILLYADLGGQSSSLIGRYASGNLLVVILDHHLPGGPVPDNVIHLNPERFNISGDNDASGASVCALFARELLSAGGLDGPDETAWLAALGVIGAVGDGQELNGAFTGLNELLFSEAVKAGMIQKDGSSLVLPRMRGMTVEEIVEVLTLLGSVGFYSGDAASAKALLMGENTDDALRRAGHLGEIKKTCFAGEMARIRQAGLERSEHFQWINVQDRFAPMGVKAIGLFLEELIAHEIAAKENYLVGFQHLPAEAPGIGGFDTALSKISTRVHPELRRSIEEGKLPDFMSLVPGATALVKGIADGCHRFAAGSLIDRGLEEDFIRALEKVLSQHSGTF
ncbi:MAG: DHH family phosphoesterase [Deltaproteobacteria bacterium]|nr:DHH family phosphoesterase [Deltaproteobacteria bacterium]